MKNPFRKLTEEEKKQKEEEREERQDWEDACRRGYVQLPSAPGRPPTPASLRNRKPVPTDAILTLWLWCAAANCIEREAMAAVSAWLDVQPEIANIKLDIEGEVQP